MNTSRSLLTAINEGGDPVDWWFGYKVPAHSEPAGVSKGNDYLYADAVTVKGGKPLALSAKKIDQNDGALFHTLNQIYAAGGGKNPDVGWYCYNDENPDAPADYKNPVNGVAMQPGRTLSARGHTKGVLAFDLTSDSGFWLIHSTPKFILPDGWKFPATGMEMAQTFLCVTLPDAATALKLARQMFQCQQPNVYAASPLPKALVGRVDDFRVCLMNDQVNTRDPKADDQLRVILPITSRGGQKFQSIAKNWHWGQDTNPKLNFYDDLVAPVLNENLDVETWEHDPTPPPRDRFSKHEVIAMKSCNLKPLGSPISWSEENDHGKLAISAPGQKSKWVCVGGMNFTLAQENRGGGTLAFTCDLLWEGLHSILSTQAEAPGRTSAGSTSPGKATPASKPPAPQNPPAAGAEESRSR